MARFPFFTAEHELFHRTVNDFVDQHCPREYVRECDQQRCYPYAFYAKVAEQGWFGLPLPEAYGGANADVIYLTILSELLAKNSFDISAGYSMIVWGAMKVARFGTEEQRQHYLPRVVTGEQRFSLSMTEPGAGSDAAALILRATEDGDHWVLNGNKVFSTGADARGNTIIVAGRTDNTGPKHRGVTLFLVDNTTPGLELRRLPTLSRRTLGTNEGFYTDVRVPKTRVLGELHNGWRPLMEYLEIERVGGAAMYMGSAQTAVSDALRYAKEREQFGQPIGKFQVIQHMLADMQTEVDAARLVTYQAAWLLNEGIRCRKEASMAKLYASETLLKVATQGMQILGGYAQLPEYDMERYWRDAKQATVGGGTSQIQRNIIAKELGL